MMNPNQKYYPWATGLIISQSIVSWLSPVAWGQTSPFVDIESHWAQPCITSLAEQNIIGGDREEQRFRPNAPMTRVELAVILTQAFPDVKPVQEPTDFVDIPSDYWAYSAIREANRRGFISSYIAGVFNPTLEVTRVQALEALTQGLNYQSQTLSIEQLPAIFADADEIPEAAQAIIAAATENGVVVNYPSVKQLKPNQVATRGEVAAIICQALGNSQQVGLIPAQYIARVPVDQTPVSTTEIVSSGSDNFETDNFETEIQEEVEVIGSEPRIVETESVETETDLSTIEINPRESINENSEQPITIGDLENVKVELLYETPEILQLTIIRKGQPRFSNFLTLSSLQAGEEADQIIDINIVDLDKDNEPEVMIDFVGKDSSNRSLYYSLIYRYSPFARAYKSLKQTWGILPYQKQISTVNNAPIFISFDRRFSQQYQSETAEHLPLQIWQYQSGEMQDQTAMHPEWVQKQTAILWLELNQASQTDQNLQGIIAAYLANKLALGEAEEGWQRVQQIYQGSDATDFFNELRQFLQETGYL